MIHRFPNIPKLPSDRDTHFANRPAVDRFFSVADKDWLYRWIIHFVAIVYALTFIPRLIEGEWLRIAIATFFLMIVLTDLTYRRSWWGLLFYVMLIMWGIPIKK